MLAIFLVIAILCIFTPPGLLVAGFIFMALLLGSGPVIMLAGCGALVTSDPSGGSLILGGFIWTLVSWGFVFHRLREQDCTKRRKRQECAAAAAERRRAAELRAADDLPPLPRPQKVQPYFAED